MKIWTNKEFLEDQNESIQRICIYMKLKLRVLHVPLKLLSTINIIEIHPISFDFFPFLLVSPFETANQMKLLRAELFNEVLLHSNSPNDTQNSRK
jgi:hypothetical protein